MDQHKLLQAARPQRGVDVMTSATPKLVMVAILSYRRHDKAVFQDLARGIQCNSALGGPLSVLG